ncbi:[LysW]-L-2-aminoadipate/[LysW]-L-glutamate phosphate reductase [Candidatus Methanoperedenaceae archaeon GB50]|nr:[LysW]-L-2-aminoadipate/[LysW]-L-glutamate phosphate reductase [Candidatus Methanoperedenaceae archaeon GB50]CAD7772210.1 MAG: [LysW]-L-2-aminoadipate/[LysW]-L-glutamate phosphate reductase [Candidatus Methanoperedenaceae archaeon GB50]
MIEVGIVGGSGYTGGELLRLLSAHPEVEVVVVTSRRFGGKPVSSIHRHLEGIYDLSFENPTPVEVGDRCDLVFTAVPHGSAMGIVPELLGSARVIDLSADYRLPPRVFEAIYGLEHSDAREAVYGLPEIHTVAGNDLVANPGCYPTGAVLAAAPLASERLLSLAVFDSKSGISGAGAEPSMVSHYPEMAENVQPYKLTTHRHRAEIVHELGRLDGGSASISFTPHVVPSVRGILTTAHLFTRESVDGGEIRKLYEKFYKNKPFIRLRETIPSLPAVRGSNFCDIYIEADDDNDRVVVITAIDNLVKGASGQAIQNMNLIFNLDETTGLWQPGLAP